jgi:hypothetical protein
VADLLVAYALPEVLGRPVVIYVDGERRDADFVLPVGHGALDTRVYRPAGVSAAARVAAVRLHWHADHYRSVIPMAAP